MQNMLEINSESKYLLKIKQNQLCIKQQLTEDKSTNKNCRITKSYCNENTTY